MFTFRKNGHFYEKIGKKGEPICIDDEIPFEVPDNWELCRLENLGISTSGKTPKAKELHSQGKYPYFKVGDMNTPGNELYLHITENYLSDDYSSKLFAPNSIVYPKNGGAVFTNKRRILKQESVVDLNTGVFSPYSCLDLMYMYMIFQSIDFKKYHKGTALPTIDKKRMDNILVGLPPFEEQKRIVEKLKEILPLIDEYGIYKERFDILNSEFPDKFKNSVLQEAIQGKLVPQDPNDEPASVLLEKINDEKERLIKEKKIKRNKKESLIYKKNNHFYEKVGKKDEPVCIDDEIPFEIPDSWEWTRIKNIVTKLTDGAHKTPKYVDKGIPFLSVKDMSSGYLDFSDTKYISQEDYEQIYQRCNYEYGDILLTKVGTTGIPIIIDTNKDFGLFVSVALLKFNHNIIYNEFLVHLINSPLVQLQCIENTKGVGNKNWVLRDIGNTLITIPPLNEQIRIVEKLEGILQKLIDYY